MLDRANSLAAAFSPTRAHAGCAGVGSSALEGILPPLIIQSMRIRHPYSNCLQFLLRLSLLALLGAALMPIPGAAHNGAVALAVPVEGITVDGDLSDWPEGMRRYPILFTEAGTVPRDAEDFQAFFQIGYSAQEGAIYVAVEVRDESTVIDTTAKWNTQDGCEVYVDLEHGERNSPVVQYVMYGDRRVGEGYVVEVSRETGAHRYEWRIEVGKGILRFGTLMGLDVVVEDKDEDGSFSGMAWGKEAAKGDSPERRGDLLLVEAGEKTGRIAGQVHWLGTSKSIGLASVRIRPAASGEEWLRTGTDREGYYEVELPEGRYQISAGGMGQEEEKSRSAVVQEGRREEVSLAVQRLKKRVQEAGKGRGFWQTLGALDGLSSLKIFALAKDRKGRLWVGTLEGVFAFTTGSALPRSGKKMVWLPTMSPPFWRIGRGTCGLGRGTDGSWPKGKG